MSKNRRDTLLFLTLSIILIVLSYLFFRYAYDFLTACLFHRR